MTTSLQPMGDVGYAEPLHYHDAQRGGFVSILSKEHGKTRQTSFKLVDLESNLSRWHGQPDVWLSQCEFFRPNRRRVNLWRMPLCYVDLDTYKLPHLENHTADHLLQLLLVECSDQSLPPPSLVVSSGRGLQVKWLFEAPAPRAALPRWERVQLQLCSALQRLGADFAAMDSARVLRLTGSTNSRSGKVVHLVHEGRTPTLGGALLPSGVVGYDFDVFADTVLPRARADIVQERLARAAAAGDRDAGPTAAAVIEKARRAAGLAGPSTSGCLRQLQVRKLAWDRLADLRRLKELRWPTYAFAGIPSGHRNIFLFLAACFLGDCCPMHEVLPELIALRDEFAPGWSHEELLSSITSALSRARACAAGHTVEFDGMKVSPKYRWRNSTLLERLAITPDEERQMQTIISKAEATRRNTERQRSARRAQGMQPREQYLEKAAQQRQAAQQLRADGLSNTQISQALGISLASAKRYTQKSTSP